MGINKHLSLIFLIALTTSFDGHVMEIVNFARIYYSSWDRRADSNLV